MSKTGPKPMLVRAHGREQTLLEWSRELGVPKKNLAQRLRNGWPPDAAMVSESWRHRSFATWRKELYEGARDLPWESDWFARFLVSEWGPMTTDEISDVMGCSLARITQIEKQAMAKIAKALGGETKAALRLLDEMRRERTLPDNGYGAEDAA